jgi:hypothetical protein
MGSSYALSPSSTTPRSLHVVPRTVNDEEAPPYDGQASKRREAFYMIPREVFLEYARQARPVAWAVFEALVCHADADGTCFPSHSTLAEETGVSRRETIITAIKRLAELGMIRVEPRTAATGANTSNQYVLLVGMHVRQTVQGMSANAHKVCPPNRTGYVRQTVQELEPLNNNQLTKEENTPLPPEGGKKGKEPQTKPTSSRKERSVPWPEDFVLTDQLRETARRAGIRADRIESVFQRFRDRNIARGERYVSWPHAWATWVNSPYQDRDREAPASTPAERREDPASAAKRAAALQSDLDYLIKTNAPEWKIERKRGDLKQAMEVSL